MAKYGYIVVEGPHDIEVVARLLSPKGFSRVKMVGDVDEVLRPLIPTFPHGGDLQKRVPAPLFLRSDEYYVAVHSAIGDSQLALRVRDSVKTLEPVAFDSVGVLLDSDRRVPVADRYAAITAELAGYGHRLPPNAGTVAPGSPRLGAYVLPDNSSEGNLEDLLMECAGAAYPSILASATAFIEDARDDPKFCDTSGEDLSKIPVFNKAVVGAVACTLRPGKSVQVSIQDNFWLKGSNLLLPKVKALQEFLQDLLEIP
jgi:hypothetical protein